jgi:hypothetical protein
VIRHDRSAEPVDPRFRGRSRVDVLDGEGSVTWGDFSYSQVLLDAFDWCLANMDFEWLVLLSGQDYPLMPIAEFERVVSDSGADGFVQAKPLAEAFPGVRGLERVDFRWASLRMRRLGRGRAHRAVFRAVARATRLAERGGRVRIRPVPGVNVVLVGWRRRRPAAVADLRIYGGSDYLTLTRDSVRAVTDFARTESAAMKFFRRTFIPSEVLLPTVLLGDGRRRICTDPVRFKWFANQSAHPEVLTTRELDHMLSSGCHFARKFDYRVDEAVLDELDRRVPLLRA